MTELKIGNCIVDFTRCHIIKDGDVISVEPKVMEVLACLYAEKNLVVSQQSIFKKVWPTAIFNPSSVQRCIAILRKAIEQDTKKPAFLITHPKRGYSLVLDEVLDAKKSSNAKTYWSFLATSITFLAVIASVWWFEHQHESPTFSQLRPVTSSESSEYDLVLSPKANIAAFVRIGGDKKNHIWLKNLKNGTERRITQEPGHYLKLGWAKDGSALAYVTRTVEDDQLNYISVDPRTLAVMPAVSLLTLSSSSVVSYQLQWSSAGQMYFVQSTENGVTLLRRYSLAEDKLTTLKAFQGNEQLLTVALSPDESSLALAFDIHQNRYGISLMTLDLLDVLPIANEEGNVRGLNWHPDSQSLLVSNNDKLQRVAISKEVTDINFDNFQYIRNAGYSHDAAEIVMELISLDVDILYSESPRPYSYRKLVDTQSLDFLPIYAPQEDKFAFESHRNGLKQIFVYEQGQQRLIFANPNNEELFGFVWSEDGKNIISASKDKLFLIDVKASSYAEIGHDQGPFYLREWYRYEDALLVSLVTENGIKPAKFDLDTKKLSVLLDSVPNFECAYMSLDQQDKLYFSDYNSIYILTDNGELDVVWQTKEGNITGFTLGENSFSVGLEYKTKFELAEVSYNEPVKKTLLTTRSNDRIHLTSTSKNADKFLFSQVKDIKKLVRLK